MPRTAAAPRSVGGRAEEAIRAGNGKAHRVLEAAGDPARILISRGRAEKPRVRGHEERAVRRVDS